MSNMTREIKFREYNTHWNKMYEPFTLVNAITAGGISERYNKHSIFMQYTGLHDKNGKEIYENDIVLFKTLTQSASSHQMIYEVRWKGKGFKPTRMSEHNQEEMEIIGNRFENPELLDKLDNFIK